MEGTSDPLAIAAGDLTGFHFGTVGTVGTILAGEIRFWDHHSPSETLSSHEAYSLQTDTVSAKTDTVILRSRLCVVRLAGFGINRA